MISDRPEFMATLELLHPYTLDDVRRAYKAKARDAHPDAGGNAADFVGISEAYHRAVEYVEYRSNPRDWVAARVERYIEQGELIAQLESFGASVELEDGIWRRRELGDFGQVGDQIVAVRISAAGQIAEVLKLLIEKQHLLNKVLLFDFGNSSVTDSELGILPAFKQLRRLDLRNTAISFAGLQILHDLNELTMLNLGGTRINRWQRFRLSRKYPQLKLLTQADVALDASPSPVAVLATGN